MREVKITAIGNSAGIILSKEELAQLNVGKGDSLFITKTPDGFQIAPYDEEFERQMQVAETIMREDRDVLRRLAK